MTTKRGQVILKEPGEKKREIREKGILGKIMSNLETIKHPSS